MPATAPQADYRPRIVDGELIGGRCESCGYAIAPATPRCPNCGGVVGPERFPTHGRVWAATVVHIPVGDREPPFGLSYVDLDDGPRVLAHSAGDAPLRSGAAVTIREVRDDLVAEYAEEAR